MIAFFDVDETLIGLKSMRSFLEFVRSRPSQRDGGGLLSWDAMVEAGNGETREQTNRRFYRMWSGFPLEELHRLGRDWFRHASEAPGFWNDRVVARLKAHRRVGHRIVFVSGSFEPCLAPIAAHLGVHEILCTAVQLDAGVLSGEIDRPMIGAAKADAALEVLGGKGAEDAWGYGDHSSDAPLLRVVGNPVAVGGEPELTALAHREGWRTLALK